MLPEAIPLFYPFSISIEWYRLQVNARLETDKRLCLHPVFLKHAAYLDQHGMQEVIGSPPLPDSRRISFLSNRSVGQRFRLSDMVGQQL